MKIEELHKALLCNVIKEPMSENEALLWMTLLHIYEIHLSSPNILEPPGITVVSAITQRHAAEVIAGLWPDRSDERAQYTYWYFKWNKKQGYEVVEEIPQETLDQLAKLRSLLLQDPRVAALVEED